MLFVMESNIASIPPPFTISTVYSNISLGSLKLKDAFTLVLSCESTSNVVYSTSSLTNSILSKCISKVFELNPTVPFRFNVVDR